MQSIFVIVALHHAVAFTEFVSIASTNASLLSSTVFRELNGPSLLIDALHHGAMQNWILAGIICQVSLLYPTRQCSSLISQLISGNVELFD